MRDWNNTGTLDKVCTKLVVTIKAKYVPEEETAADAVTKEVNLIDGGFSGEDSDDEPQDSGTAGGFDLT